MGTNFYTGKGLHIGKSSAGWHFALHIYPERQINNYEDWIGFLKNKKIKNEYGSYITINELKEIICDRKREDPIDEDLIAKDFYYKNLEDFLCKNHAVIGMNNLLSDNNAVKHPKFPIDYIKHDFC